MFYRSELQFLCDTLKKSRVRTVIAAPSELASAVSDLGAGSPFVEEPWVSPDFPSELEPYSIYKLTDAFDLCYTYLLLPETAEPTVLLIGPFLSSALAPERLLELGKKCGISPSRQMYFEEYYQRIPLLPAGNHLFVMLTTFCELIWKSPSFAIVDVNKKNQLAASPINEPMHDDEFDDILINIKAMEKRYAFENELIQAVTLGQLHKKDQLFSVFSEQSFEKRLNDPLRNAKNYGVIMNTLLRKAAENGGVHPIYLDRISSEFASKIEHMRDLSENADMMREIFRSYCRLVRKHAMVYFSLVVQKAILLIDSDLAANLSLKSLANNQNVSPGYLSTIFKKETGKTVSEYIREKRIQHAKYLLTTTHQQIQTVALNCGIMDVQYFSKTFKRLTGKTPMEYRESLKQPQNK